MLATRLWIFTLTTAVYAAPSFAAQTSIAAKRTPATEISIPSHLGTIRDAEVRTCQSAEDFIRAFEFLKKETDLSLNEVQSLKLALQIVEGCTGSAQRFIDVYLLLKKSGVTLKASLESAMTFSKLDDERTKNFVSVFKQSFLGKFLDLDFATAFRLSFVLSQFLGDKVRIVRDDFSDLVLFCTDAKKVGLPLHACADYAMRVIDLTPLYKQPIYPHFFKIYQFLTQGGETKDLQKLSITEALETSYQVLSYGPKSTTNFFKAYEYAMSKSMSLPHKQSIELALRLSKLSMIPEEAPLEAARP